MNQALKILLLLALVTPGLALALTLRRYVQLVQDRFPGTDPKIARKAYLNMLRNAFGGEYSDDQLDGDDRMDEIFLSEVQKLTNH